MTSILAYLSFLGLIPGSRLPLRKESSLHLNYLSKRFNSGLPHHHDLDDSRTWKASLPLRWVLFYFWLSQVGFHTTYWSRKALTCSFGSGHSPTHLCSHSVPFLTCIQTVQNCLGYPWQSGLLCGSMPVFWLFSCQAHLIPLSTWRISTWLLRNIFTLSLFQALGNSEQNNFCPAELTF